MGVDAVELAVRDLVVSYGGAPVLTGVDLDVHAGEVLALLGPSGCGKTTLLRAVAGLEEPLAGAVQLGGRVLSRPGEVVVPERRGVAMVFQDWALFPHLDVAGNVGFPLAGRGGPAKAERAAVVARTLALVGLESMGERMPDTLSGGQQQRVALARALAQSPEALLLDEPFSNLDAGLRARVRADVRALLAELGVTTVLVTHDRDEAFALGDRVAVMRGGRVLQVGTPRQLYEDPVDPWVARFVGEMELLDGEADGERATTVIGPVTLRHPRHGAVRVGIRPEDLEVRGDDRGGWTVASVEYRGSRASCTVVSTQGELRVEEPGRRRRAVGDRVAVSPPAAPVVAWLSDVGESVDVGESLDVGECRDDHPL